MIRSIQLENFQAHRLSNLEFCDGLNVITGSSDSGKSSIIRAFLWVLKNRPTGDSVRNWNCKKGDKTEVSIFLDDDRLAVIKTRIDGKATYKIQTESDYDVFEAFKQDVPDEIVSTLNLSEINVQTQHDPYFLLNDSPGEVARKLNELVGLDAIDRLFKFLNSRIIDAKRSIDNEITRSKSLSDEIQNLDYLDRLEMEIKGLDDLKNRYDLLLEEYTEVDKLVSHITDCDVKISSFDKILLDEKQINSLIGDIQKYLVNKEELNEVIDLTQNISDLDTKIKDETDWLAVEEHYNEIKRQIDDFNNLTSNYSKIDSTVSLIWDTQRKAEQLQVNYEQLKAQYRSILMKNKICPFCQSQINEETVKGMLQ